MALTITKKLPNGQPDGIGGFSYMQVADILFDSSYPTGGESLTAADLGFQPSVKVVMLAAEPALGFTFQYDRTNSLLKVLVPGLTIGAAGAVTIDDFPISGVGATATSVGLASSATTPIRFGGLLEVANTENLSTVTTRVVAFGAVV